MTKLLLRRVEVDGTTVDVGVRDGRITAVDRSLIPDPATEVIDGRGGALLPGLWDHHIHLVSLAAARRSVEVGPPAVTDPAGLAAALSAAQPSHSGGWIRAVGYHESVAGDLDRDDLDRLVPDVALRVQHRSGAMWVLNSTAISRLGLEEEAHRGLERDGDARLTGRIYGADRWLGERIERDAAPPPPDLAAIGRELAGYGVTGVTDATPYVDRRDLDLLAAAASSGAVPQRVVAMGGPGLAGEPFPGSLRRGPVKLLLADHALPSLDELAAWITRAHRNHRPIAAHCVTRASLVLALTALDAAGAIAGDRIEHGAVVPPELRDWLSAQQLTVVTQPNFVAERGDRYLTDVDADDRPHLYPCRSLLDAGVEVAGSTDAPFGHPDPWRAIAAAVERRTARGHAIGEAERISPARALQLFLGTPDRPGGPVRTIAPGRPADLCLLDAPLGDALVALSADQVRLTLIAGEIAHAASP